MENETQPIADTQPVAEPVVEQVVDVEPQETEQVAPKEVDYSEVFKKPVQEWNLTPEQLNDPKFHESLEKQRLMQSDYTKKTQELSEERKRLQTEAILRGQWSKDRFMQERSEERRVGKEC